MLDVISLQEKCASQIGEQDRNKNGGTVQSAVSFPQSYVVQKFWK